MCLECGLFRDGVQVYSGLINLITLVLVDCHGHAVAGRIADEGGAVAGLHDRPALDVVRLSRRQTGDTGGPSSPMSVTLLTAITNQFA